METSTAGNSLLANLEALYAFVVPIDSAACNVTRLLQNAIMHWRSVSPHEAISATLAAQNCEVVVGVLRLLRRELELPPSRGVHAYTCAFLVLAGTVRVFEDAWGVPAPGQQVMLSGLQSATAQQLNGAWGVVMRFHAESGRFIVRLQLDDPPSEWKKVRAENLTISQNGSVEAQAMNIARSHGLSCLEAVADIFDDLLQDIMLEAYDSEDDSVSNILCAELASAMWEVLVCCAGDGALRLSGASFAELCGSTALCTLFARYILSTHIGLHSGLVGCLTVPDDKEIRRLLSLQESLAQSYSELYQPAAYWRKFDEVGDAPMKALQADLDAHVRNVAEAAVNFSVLPAFIDAVDFHLTWATVSNAARPRPLPIVLPMILSRFVCTLVAPTLAAVGVIQRHVQLHMRGLLEVLHCFALLSSARLISHGSGGTPATQEITLALRVVLDAIVAITSIGLWSLGAEVAQLLEDIAAALLDAPCSAIEPAILARLILIYVRQPPAVAGVPARIVNACSSFDEVSQASLWRNVCARASLCRMQAAEIGRLAQEWFVASGGILKSVDVGEAVIAESGGAIEEASQRQEVDRLIEKCLRDMPQSLRELPATPRWRPPSSTEGVDHGEAQVSLQPFAEAFTSAATGGLSMLDMPLLPNQSHRPAVDTNGLQANGTAKHRTKKLARADFGKIRGVDISEAPEALRCAIDGKILGNPLRSPYGHLFERETLEHWISMCGSICPLTGQPLRLDDCSQDRDVERQVLDWAKTAKADYRRRVQEKRQARAQNSPQDLAEGILL